MHLGLLTAPWPRILQALASEKEKTPRTSLPRDLKLPAAAVDVNAQREEGNAINPPASQPNYP